MFGDENLLQSVPLDAGNTAGAMDRGRVANRNVDMSVCKWRPNQQLANQP